MQGKGQLPANDVYLNRFINHEILAKWERKFTNEFERVSITNRSPNHLVIMVKLTQEMIDAFKATKQFAFATASKNGEPNVTPMGSVFLIDPETVWIGNNFMNRTIKNLKENPRAVLLVWTPGVKGCLKVKAETRVVESGADYEKVKEMVKARKPDLNCRSLVVLKITEVDDCRSGPEAGKKII